MKTSRELEAALYQKYGGNASTSQNANQQTTKSAGSRSEELGNALYEKYVVGGDANRQKVSNWVAKYNQTTKGISDYTKKRNGAYTDDPSGGYSNKVEELLNEFAEIRDYADRSGLPNAQRYYTSLLDLRDFIAQENEVLKAKEGMRAYEDEMIAAMERNEQLRKNQQAAAFGIDPTNMTMGFFDKFQKYTDDSHRAVTDQWTDEQRYELGLRQMEDPASAAQFATDVNNYYKYQANEPERQQIRKQATENILGSTGKALLGSTFTAQDAFLDRMAEHAARGQITEKDYLTTWDRAQEATGAISEMLNENAIGSDRYNEMAGLMKQGLQQSGVDDFYKNTGFMDLPTKMFEGKGLGDLYNMGYSMAQNTLSRFSYGMVPIAGEAMTLANYFASAAASGIDEARRKGATSDQAVTSGILKGTWEVATEVLGLDNLYKMGPAVTWGDLIKQLGIQGVFEGVGEGVNTALGYASDALVLGDLSEYWQSVQHYKDQGETEERAKWLAFQDAAKNVGFDALTGAVSGWISGGAETAYKTGQANMAYRSVDPQTLIAEGLNTEEGSKAYQRAVAMQEAMDNGQDISGNDKRVLAQTVELQKLAEEKAAAEAAATSDLMELGQVENLEQLADLVARKSMGEELSWKDKRTIRDNRNVQTLLSTMEESGEGIDSSTPQASVYSRSSEDTSSDEAPPKAANGRAIQYSTQSGVEAHDFAEVNGGKDAKVTIQLKDGGTAELSDLTFESEAEQDRFAAVASLPGIDTEHANDLLHTIQEAGAGLDLDSIVGIREAYRLGRMAASETELADSAASVLSPKLQGEIYAIGLDQSNAIAKAPINVRKTDAKPSKGYKKVIFEGEIVQSADKKLQKKMESEIRFMDFIADKFSGTPVHVFQSYERDGKMYYTDNNGVEHAAPNGKYSNGEIWVDLNAGDTENGMVLNTFAHEMYHHIEKNNRAAANKLAEFVVKELGMKSVDAAVQKQIEKAREAGYGEEYFTSRGYSEVQAKNEVEMRAMSDFVADSLETMFTRGDVEGSVARLYNEDKGLFFKVKKFIDKWVKALKEFYGDKTISQEGYEVAQLERFEELQRMFMEAMKGAGENYRAALEALTPGEEGVVVNKNGDPVAMSTEDGSVMLSIRTYEEDGREAFRNYLQKCVSSNRLTKAEMQEMIDGIEEVYQICKEFKDKYAPFSAWSDAEVIRDTRGRPVFSVVTPNGDYKMNLDFSLVCKKRRTLDAVFNEMSRRGIIDDFELGQKSVVKINEIIRKHGLETACALCFVDAKRFRQASMADSFTRLYNELVESLVPDDQRGSIDHFNFAGYETIHKVDGGIDTWSNSKLDFSHLDKVMKEYGKGTVEYKAAKYIKNNPKGRKLLLRGDFMSSQGFDAVKTQNQDILKLYNSKKGTGGPKAAFGDVQYLNEIIRKERSWTPAKAYSVGGVRIQSFSDYVPRMVFDYTQMIYDLAATKLPAHAYSKESLFVKQFGLTGVKINMSLIPAVAEGGIAPGLDADGNYVWAGESFNYDEAVKIQYAEGYSENCGTICVGVSKKHIEKLLRDPNIRMVIPYHKSGLNPIVAHMNKIAEFTDYTGEQRTKGKDGKAISKDFDFSKSLHDMGANANPKAVADQYLKWCVSNGYTPKFAEFAAEENYYKLLEDFTLYDKDGNYVPQREVRSVFPKETDAFGSMKSLIQEGLQEDAIVEGKRDKNLSSIVDEIQRTLPKTEAEISEEQVAQADWDLEEQFSHRKTNDDNGNVIPLSERFNLNVEDTRYSLRNQQPTTRDILTQVDLSTRNKAEQHHLGKYQEQVELLADLEPRLAEANEKVAAIPADDKPRRKERLALLQEARVLKEEVNRLKRLTRAAEQSDMMRKIVAEEKLKAQKEEAKNTATIWEKEFVRVVKQYEKLDEKTGKRTIKDAATITKLQNALKAEAKAHEEDSAIWEKEFNRLLRDYETSGRQIERLEATIARQRATSKARVESRRKTEMRHKIQRKTDELNRLLLHGSKHRNVPEFLQPAVADILKAINMEVRDGEQRRKTYEANLARYDRQIAATSDPAKVTELIEKRNEYAAKGDQFANKMENLKKAYEEIEENKIPGMEIDEGLADRLKTLFTEVGDTPLWQMTEAQLEAVNEVLNITKATVRNANEMLAEARSAGVVETSKAAIAEIRRAGETKKTKTPLRKKLEQFGWNNLKPVYAFDVIGSKTLKDRYEALRRGEDTLAKDLSEAKNFFREQWKKNGGKDWDMDKKRKFTSTSGKSFELDLNQIMTLYALAKDKDARSHLRVGGFAFDSDYQTKEDINLGPVKIPVKVESADATAYNLSDEILGEIISTLTPQQRAFADAMQAYLSDTMAAKGNEVSLKKYGIRLFKKKDYFPIRVADQFMAKAREQQAGERKLKDSGFTKERKPEAKNPVVLSGFTEVWAEHVDEMSLYHSFVLPLDDFNRVLNYHDAFVEGQEAVSVVGAITNAFGKGATNYIDQLIKDVNGGIKGGSTVSFANNLMSKAKKAQTMASLSVAIQQPSSIIRAMSEIDIKHFIGPRVTEKSHDRIWNEIKKYAPIAIIKEMGGYDTNVGKSTVDYLTDTSEYSGFWNQTKAMFADKDFRKEMMVNGQVRDDYLGRLPAWTDEVSWGVIWNAVKREQRDRHPNMDTKSDAFMKLVANRFTEVITRTQVYDSVFSRSGLMRDRKSDLAKMTTSFMAEPTTTANMLAVSILQASRGDINGKQEAKTVGSIVASLALNAALVSVIYALRDDDEDKRYDEKWIENFYSNFFESLNPLGYIPYVRDIYNLFAKGYDVERADMELFGDLQNAIEGLGNENITAWEKTENVIGAIGNLLGVPVKNILRDVKGFVQTLGFMWDDKPNPKTKTGKYMARRGMDLSDGEEMILALQRGDEEHIQRVFGRFESQEKAQSALQSAIGEQYREGKLTVEEAEQLLTDNFDRDDEHEIYWLFDKWDYTKEHGTDERWTKYGRFMEGVETGDFQTEMERLMEHGADASDIRTQITRGYKKQYMEGDETARQEIRDMLDPVYKATGMYPDEIQKKFHDWDFEAEFGMGYSEYRAEFRDGNITESELKQAMKFYGLKNYEIETDIRTLKDEIRFKNKFGMTMTEMQDSYDRGDVSRNTMLSAKMFTGMTKTEAQKWITQRDISNQMGIDYAYLDDAYKYGDISRNDLRNAILKNGETVQNTDEAMLGYDWLKKNIKKYPDLGISDAKKFAVRIHSDYAPDETLEDYGVSVEAYTEYQKLRPECKGVDANGDGKTDPGTLRDSVFAMIDSLPITSEAKDGLALMSYSARSIRRNAPWH